MIVIGTGKLACAIAREVEGRQDSVYKILAFIGTDEPEYNPTGVPVFPQLEDMGPAASLPKGRANRRRTGGSAGGDAGTDTFLQCKLRGIIVEQGVSFYEQIAGRILVEGCP